MSWQTPSEAEILKTVDATWPAARYDSCGPFTLRYGMGGGQRVSAASATGPADTTQIAAAEQAMLSMGQQRLFMITAKDAVLDKTLKSRGFAIKDPVTMFAAPIEALTKLHPSHMTIEAQTPLEAMKEIWATGHIEKGRLDVMARAKGAKIYLFGRANERPAGAAFVAMHGETAMLHALEILPSARRQGLGLSLSASAVSWAMRQGAKTFTLVAVSSNQAACGLYRQLGMTEVGYYHYRKKE